MSWVGTHTDGLAARRAHLVTAYEEVASVRRSAEALLSTVGEHVDLMPLIGIEGFTQGWARRIDAASLAVSTL